MNEASWTTVTVAANDDDMADIVRFSEVDCPPWTLLMLFVCSARLTSRKTINCHMCAVDEQRGGLKRLLVPCQVAYKIFTISLVQSTYLRLM